MNILDKIDSIVNEKSTKRSSNKRKFKPGKFIAEAAGFDSISKVDDEI